MARLNPHIHKLYKQAHTHARGEQASHKVKRLVMLHECMSSSKKKKKKMSMGRLRRLEGERTQRGERKRLVKNQECKEEISGAGKVGKDKITTNIGASGVKRIE